jgi:hypothetical protein
VSIASVCSRTKVRSRRLAIERESRVDGARVPGGPDRRKQRERQRTLSSEEVSAALPILLTANR